MQGHQNPKSMQTRLEVNVRPKLNIPLPYTNTYTTIKQNTKSCTYVGLYGSGLFNFGSYVNLQTFTENVFYIFLLFLFPLIFFVWW